MVKFLGTERRMVAARGWEEEEIYIEFHLGEMKKFWRWKWWWTCEHVDSLSATETIAKNCLKGQSYAVYILQQLIQKRHKGKWKPFSPKFELEVLASPHDVFYLIFRWTGEVFPISLYWMTHPIAKSSTSRANSKSGVQTPFLIKRSQCFLETWPNPGLGGGSA